MNEIRYFSMFTGVGGFELGLEANNPKPLPKIEQDEQRRNGPTDEQGTLLRTRSSATFRCVGMSEWDKYSSQVLKYRFPNIKNWGDCTKIRPEDLPDFDMLCGGFPCQAFSIAGKRRGFEDTRGTMFFEVARILQVKRPKIVLLENVKGLLNHNKGETFRVILQTLDELGYEVQWMVLNSKFFGVPQNRERVFIIGSLRGEPLPEILPFRTSNEEINGESNPMTLLDINQAQRVYSTDGTSITIKSGGGGQGAKTGLYSIGAMRGRNIDNPNSRISGLPTKQRLEINENGTSNCLSTIQKDNMVINDMKIRRLTPTECERLQGFPNGWTEGFSDTQRYKMMGNAVTVNVIQALGTKLLKTSNNK